MIGQLAPQRGQDLLAEFDHVVLVDEAHLDVELGELRLPVGAEVLVAVAARDLEVALQAADHQQLLEQLRRLRQRIPVAGLQPGRDQEVPGALRRRAGHGRRLDLDEVAAVQHVPGDAVDLAAHPHDPGRLAAPQVQVAVPEPDLLADLQVVVQRERQRRGLGKHLKLDRGHLDLAGGYLRVLVARRAADHLAGDPDAELGAQPVGALGHLAFAEHDLGDTGGVSQIDEDDPAVIATARHPPGEGDGLPGMTGAKRSGLVRAHHGY